MTKSWLIGTTALMLLASGAWAADEKAATTKGMEHGDSMMGGRGHHKDMTLEEARTKAHQRAEKLDKMTPAEWEQKKQMRKERREKWKAMSPEDKQKFKDRMQSKRMQHMDGKEGAPAPAQPAAQ